MGRRNPIRALQSKVWNLALDTDAVWASLMEKDASFTEHVVETFLCLVPAIIALAYTK